jgi:uncharacterized protein YndB with AHSA1/START domain
MIAAMAPVTDTVEIARSPEEIFAYMDQLERHSEWQTQIVGVTRETEGPTGAGTRATEVRKTPMGKQSVTYELTEYDAPRKVSFRGLNGSIRPVGTVTVEPIGEGRSRLTFEMELQGHGLLGKILAPLAQRDAHRQVPKDQQRLKERLEAGA